MKDLLYHYCSNSTFQKIIENNSIRLSSLKYSNDSLEGMVLSDVLINMARDDNLSGELLGRLQMALDQYNKQVEPFGLCFSSERDLLSQWRGYADDGQGMVIGFNRSALQEICEINEDRSIHLFEILYDLSDQRESLKDFYNFYKSESEVIDANTTSLLEQLLVTSYETIEKQKKRSEESFSKVMHAFNLLKPNMFSFKIKAFAEEKEWRLIEIINLEGISDPYIADCKYDAGEGIIRPYRELDLSVLERNPVRYIGLGPRNRTPKHIVQSFLINNNVEAVVHESAASYRYS